MMVNPVLAQLVWPACPVPACCSGTPEALELRIRCSQLEEQVEQQQKIIRYLQGQQGGSKGPQVNDCTCRAAEHYLQVALVFTCLTAKLSIDHATVTSWSPL